MTDFTYDAKCDICGSDGSIFVLRSAASPPPRGWVACRECYDAGETPACSTTSPQHPPTIRECAVVSVIVPPSHAKSMDGPPAL